MKPGEPIKDVGILGGGQLGCMLADAALALNLNPRIFAEPSSPAAALFPERTVTGAFSDSAVLRGFLSQVRVVAFENEFLDCDLLERAAAGLPLRFAPSPEAIRKLQDKLEQKRLLVELGLPTAAFEAILPEEDAAKAIARAYELFDGQVVLKWSRMGYDGKGVCLAKDTQSGRKEALEFCQQSLQRGVPVYAERKIAFRRELAMIGCQSASGEFAAYPLVTSEQERGICKRVLGPATALGASPSLEREAREACCTLARALQLEGAFALELFETQEGALCVNEIAPRVHNSGHYSQDACVTSQFENHWRAVIGPQGGLKLGEIGAAPGFGMLNLLGPEGVDLHLPRSRAGLPFSAPPEPLKLHWYAKAEVRPWRKVGHLNAAVRDPGQLSSLEEQFERYHSGWVTRLRELQAQRSPTSL